MAAHWATPAATETPGAGQSKAPPGPGKESEEETIASAWAAPRAAATIRAHRNGLERANILSSILLSSTELSSYRGWTSAVDQCDVIRFE